MNSKSFRSLLLFVFVISLGAYANALDLSSEYQIAVSDYFQASPEVVLKVSDLVSNEEGLPVVFFLAERTNTNAMTIARKRNSGLTWNAITKDLGLTTVDYYVMINSTIKSKTFAPIFDKFKAIDESKWSTIALSDKEIINLVNIKFIYSHYDYSVFNVMAMRDYAKSYMRINQQVKQEKKKLLDKSVAEQVDTEK